MNPPSRFSLFVRLLHLCGVRSMPASGMRAAHATLACLLPAALILLATVRPAAADVRYRWESFAGSVGGTGDRDATGAEARFNSPGGVAMDGSGNIFVADISNHTIRKITGAGVVSTFAGTAGVDGSADGTGSEARFSYPTSVAVDGSGNVFVADTNNQTVRKITGAGVVSTVAGAAGSSGSVDGTGSAARFDYPCGVAVDANGNVFVAEARNQTIRKITSAGVVTTFAGMAGEIGNADGIGSVARFSSPGGVAVDGNGNVFVADSYNQIVRKITSAGVVTTLAGRAGKSGSADGTGRAARFAYPKGVAVDGSGNVFVADYFNNSIRRITGAGVVTTFAGLAAGYDGGSADGTGRAAQFYQPGGLAVDGLGNVFIADTGNHTIRKITGAGVTITLAGMAAEKGSADGTRGAARFSTPRGVEVDGTGNVFITDTDNHTIRKITKGGMVTTLAGTAGATGSVDAKGRAARFYYPEGLTVDGNGNVFVADGNNTIRKITSAGVVTTLAGRAGKYGSADGTGRAARFNDPRGVAVDGSGNVFVADTYNYTIRRITGAGVVTTFAGSAGSDYPWDGTGPEAGFTSPSALAMDGSGNVFVVDDEIIRKITSAGVVTTLRERGIGDGVDRWARFYYPCGVAVDGSGNVFVADSGNNIIRKITRAGVVTTIGGQLGHAGNQPGVGGAASFDFPLDIAVGGDGTLYVVSHGAQNVVMGIPISGVTLEQPAGRSLSVAGNTVEWGPVELAGSSSGRDFTIKNDGQTDLTGLSISIASSPAGEFTLRTPPGVSLLAPGASATFSVTFSPAAVGSRTATLRLVSDDQDRPVFDVTLAGIGTDTTAPVLAGIPANMIVETTSVGGTVVSYTASSATDHVGVTSLTSLPASGSIFPFGTTTVAIIASDAAGNKSVGSFTVTVQDSTSADLASLSVPGAALTPRFDRAVTNYTAILGHAATSTGLVALAHGGGSLSQSPMNPVALAEGANLVQVKVTSLDGLTTKTYSLTVQRTVPDTAAPLVKIIEPAASGVPATFTISGTVQETVGLASFSVKLNGVALALDAPLGADLGVAIPWSVTGVAAENGSNTILVEAVDYNGHRETATKTVTYVHRRPALAGTYRALLVPVGTPGVDKTGLVAITVTATGSFTGSAILGGNGNGGNEGNGGDGGDNLGGRVALSGVLENDGSARFNPALGTALRVLGKAQADGNLGPLLTFSVTEFAGLSGTLSTAPGNGTLLATFAGLRSVAKAPVELLKSPVAKAGIYTVALPWRAQSGLSACQFPQGDGPCTLSVRASGAVRLTGHLADGSRLSASGHLATDHSAVLFAGLYGKAGSFATRLVFDTDPAAHYDSDLLGPESLWIRPARSGARYYKEGWPAGVLVDVVGAKYDAARRPNVLPGVTADGLVQVGWHPASGNATLIFSDGQLDDVIDDGIYSPDVYAFANIGVLDPNKVTIKPPFPGFTLSLSTRTGLFRGTFPHSDGTRPIYHGVLLQKGLAWRTGGSGYFLSTPPDAASGPGESGYVLLFALLALDY